MGEITIADIRYAMTVILIVIVPIVVSYWIIIHGGIRFWKTRPTWIAFTVALIGILISLVPILPNLREIAGADLGHQPLLLGLGILLYLSSLRLSSRIRPYLSFRTFAGIPEIKDETESLIISGPFEVVRHPRYFMIGVATLGWVLATNFVGAYIFGGVFVLGLLLIIQIEERELVGRFGDAYLDYRQRVPMVIPKPMQIGQLFV